MGLHFLLRPVCPKTSNFMVVIQIFSSPPPGLGLVSAYLNSGQVDQLLNLLPLPYPNAYYYVMYEHSISTEFQANRLSIVVLSCINSKHFLYNIQMHTYWY